MRNVLSAAAFILLAFMLAACGGRTREVLRDSFPDPTPYLPPTLAVPSPVPTATVTATVEAPRPTPPPACSSNLTFEEDLTFPDGSLVSPDQSLDKRWQVKNSGACNWDETYTVRLIAGPDLGAPAEQALYPARSGAQAVIRVLLTSPTEPGTYRSAWQAHDSQGEPFGDPFFIEFLVVQTTSPSQ